MPRFFVPASQIDGDTVRITGEDAYHIARALRMAVGDTLVVCDRDGGEYHCRLCRIRDEEVLCDILSSGTGHTESPLDITLYMGYPKGDKLETVIQKAVELGAARVVPFISSRCVKIPKADKAKRQGERLNRIAEEAAKQCGRSRLPQVSEPLPFADMLSAAVQAELPLFCYEGEGTISLRAVLAHRETPRTVAVIVGCEGGFSPEEATAATVAGCIPVGLGPRILRCETAPDYILSAVSYRYELND